MTEAGENKGSKDISMDTIDSHYVARSVTTVTLNKHKRVVSIRTYQFLTLTNQIWHFIPTNLFFAQI